MSWLTWAHNFERSRIEIQKGDIDPAWNLSEGEIIIIR